MVNLELGQANESIKPMNLDDLDDPAVTPSDLDVAFNSPEAAHAELYN